VLQVLGVGVQHMVLYFVPESLPVEQTEHPRPSGELFRGDAVMVSPKASLLDDCYFLGTENSVAEDSGKGRKHLRTREVQVSAAA
jgi:hypothetical protein